LSIQKRDKLSKRCFVVGRQLGGASRASRRVVRSARALVLLGERPACARTAMTKPNPGLIQPGIETVSTVDRKAGKQISDIKVDRDRQRPAIESVLECHRVALDFGMVDRERLCTASDNESAAQ
jgi:hypothetical protein